MLAQKRAGKIITIGLPDGRDIRLQTFVASWRRILNMDPRTQVANWDREPITAGEILHKISRGVHDRINQKVGDVRKAFERNGKHCRRVHAKLEQLYARGHIVHECRWCGSHLPQYTPHHARFCEPSCRNSYYN